MLKKLAKTTLTLAALTLGAQQADAATAKVKDVSISIPNTEPITLAVTGANGQYNAISNVNLILR